MSFQFRPIGKNCAATGEPLPPGTMCYSVLVEREGKLVRFDYAEDAWTEPPEDAIGVWRAAVPEAEVVTSKPMEPHEMMAFFEQLSESPNHAQQRLQYVLALLLMRKRRLSLEGSETDGDVEYLRFQGTHGEGSFLVRDHNLSDAEIQQLQSELDQQIQGQAA